MTVKQAEVEQEELQWRLMPDNWSQLRKSSGLSATKRNGINDVAEVANEANRHSK